MTILQYLQSAYDISHFPYFSLVAVCNRFGDEIAKEASNELLKDGKIKKRMGINSILIQLIIKP